MFLRERFRPFRRIVCAILWSWLFALAVGVANACVVRADAHGTAMLSGMLADGAPLASDGHADPALDSCKHSCERNQGPLAKPVTDPPDPGMAASAHLLAAAALPDGIAGALTHRARLQLPPGPPVAIRFSRLTI